MLILNTIDPRRRGLDIAKVTRWRWRRRRRRRERKRRGEIYIQRGRGE